MAGIWRPNINLIRTGQAVDAQVTNRPLRDLADRTQYLRDRLDAQAIGEGLILTSQSVAAAVQEQDIVYYDAANCRFDRARAIIDEATARTAAQAYAVGVVIRKLTEETADLLIRGRHASVAPRDHAGNPASAGPWYLSATAPGRVTSSRPAVGVYVGMMTADGFLMDPALREVLEDHIHHRFSLVTDPAGTPVCAEGRVSLTDEDDAVEGWLSADHAIFQGAAPLGAKFGYNLIRNAQLAATWPPQPTTAAVIELGGAAVSSEFAQITASGIWWMTDCATQVPWRAHPCGSSSGPEEPCPPTAADWMTLWFVKLCAKTDQAVVTGVRSKSGSPIIVSGCAEPDPDGYRASRIELDIDIPWNVAPNAAGAQVVKEISGYGDLEVGPVVEGVLGAGLISASGTISLPLGGKAGIVTLTGLDPSSITRQLDVALVALSGAVEGLTGGLPYVGLPAGRAASFTGRIRIPALQMVTPRLRLTMWFAALSAGTLPQNVTLSGVLVPPAGGGTILPGPDGWSGPPVDLSLGALGNLLLRQYASVESNPAAGSGTDLGAGGQIYFFRISRSANDGYAGELAVVNMFGTVYDAGT